MKAFILCPLFLFCIIIFVFRYSFDNFLPAAVDFYTLVPAPTQSSFFPYFIAGNAIETKKINSVAMRPRSRHAQNPRKKYTVHRIEIEASMFN